MKLSSTTNIYRFLMPCLAIDQSIFDHVHNLHHVLQMHLSIQQPVNLRGHPFRYILHKTVMQTAVHRLKIGLTQSMKALVSSSELLFYRFFVCCIWYCRHGGIGRYDGQTLLKNSVFHSYDNQINRN